VQSSDALGPKYSELVYNGFWFSPEREALQALITETQRDVTGVVRLKIYKGNVIVTGRKSPKSLYDPKIATMEGDASAYDQNDATGFIRLNALRLKLRASLTTGQVSGLGSAPRAPNRSRLTSESSERHFLSACVP